MLTESQLKAAHGIVMRNTAEDEPSAADVYIYDDISNSEYWGVSAKAFAEQINALDVEQLNVYVNSPGGSAWDGMAIMNALRRHKANVTVTVDALAASAASVITMAGDRIVMNRGAEMMIHDASGLCWGNAQDMSETASVLDRLSDSYADAYAARAGGDRAKWRNTMKAETWYTAEEAVIAGLADEWVDAPPAAACAKTFDRGKFNFRARAESPAPAISRLPDIEPEEASNQKEESTMADMEEILAAGLRERLGITDADASADQIFEALDEQLTRPDPPRAELPEGATVIDQAVLSDLQDKAEAGVKALAEQTAQRRDRIVMDALRDGRITPASRGSWRAQLDKDEEGAAELLAQLAPNRMPVDEIGVGKELTADDAQYAAAWGEGE